MTTATPIPPRAPSPPPAPSPPTSGTSSWGSITAGIVLVALGAAWLLDLADVIDLRAAYVLPVLLGFVGLVLMVGSFRGPHTGLIVFGTFLTVVTAFAAIAPSEAVRGGVGERSYVVTEPAELDRRYELGVGDMSLDLSDLELTDRRTVRVSIGAGDLNVILPDDLPVLVDAESGAGEIVVFGDKVEGVGLEKTFQSDGYRDATARLKLTLELGAGSIEVRQ